MELANTRYLELGDFQKKNGLVLNIYRGSENYLADKHRRVFNDNTA